MARRTVARSESPINPYAADGYWNNYGVAAAAGADPVNYGDAAHPQGAGNHFYFNGDGWAAPVTRNDYSGTPDPTRVEELPRTDRRASLRAFWQWWGGYDAETKRREAVTEQQTVGFEETKGSRSRAPHPLWTPPPEPRPTQQMNPHKYYFVRPFDQDVIRMGNRGAHMSMADNRRAYPILLQSPIPWKRNTYRAEPSPWDTDILDETKTQDAGFSGGVQNVDLPLASYHRSYRAG